MHVGYEEGYEGWVLETCTHTHARWRSKRGAEETESKDYFGIGEDKPGQRRACVRKREKERERKKDRAQKRTSPRLALPRRKREWSLEVKAWVIVVLAAIMNLALHKRKRNDNERRVQASGLWIILRSSYRLPESYFGDFPWTIESHPTSKRSGVMSRLCVFFPRDP